MLEGRAAAVDYGRRRIGLAVSDPLGLIVRGLDTLDRGRADQAPLDLEASARAVAAVLQGERVVAVVVGLPLHESGEVSPMAREAMAFADALRGCATWRVVLHHEGLTSWDAEERLRARGVPLKDARRRGLIDQEAACLLLRSWLDESQGT